MNFLEAYKAYWSGEIVYRYSQLKGKIPFERQQHRERGFWFTKEDIEATNWEIYHRSPMTYSEAMKYFQEGKTVGNTLAGMTYNKNRQRNYTFSINEIETDTWYLVEEEKKKCQ